MMTKDYLNELNDDERLYKRNVSYSIFLQTRKNNINKKKCIVFNLSIDYPKQTDGIKDLEDYIKDENQCNMSDSEIHITFLFIRRLLSLFPSIKSTPLFFRNSHPTSLLVFQV